MDSKLFLGTPQKLSNRHRAFARAQDKWRDWALRTKKGGNYGYQALLGIFDKNIVVLSATDAENVSQEMKNVGHGVFTYALLEGLKGKADLITIDGGKKITFSELNAYVTGMVKHLTKNRQIPISQASSDGFVDFTFVQL